MEGGPVPGIDLVAVPDLDAQSAFGDAPALRPELAPPLGAEGGHETGEIPVTVVAPVKLHIVADQQPMAAQQFDLVIGGESDVP